MERTIRITHISLTKGAGKKDKESLIASYQEKEPKSDKWFTVDGEEHEEPIHADFRQALANLKIHWAILVGFVSIKEVKNIKTPKEEFTEGVVINGFTLNGKEQEKISLVGNKKVEFGSVTIPAPVQNELVETENSYPHMEHLAAMVARACEEGILYLTGEKRGDSQPSLFAGNGKEVEVEEVEA